MLELLRTNLRWLGAGLLLTFASSFGQTWFISLFAGEIKAIHGLTDGAWGTLYTVATLAAAALLFARGALADTMALDRLAPALAVLFAAAGLAMALGHSIWLLGLSLFLLRFCGQGMFTHVAMTAMGRWFRARRGQAVSIAGLGFQLGEVLLPLPAVLLMGWIGWQATWGVVAAVLALVVAPTLLVLLAREREPQGDATDSGGVPGLGGLHWSRREALRHWLFPALVPILLTPGFVGTVVFFHQVHIAKVKGWTLAQMAPGYAVYATMSVVAALTAGWAADRFGPTRLLPFLLVPMGVGVILIGPAVAVSTWFVALAILALTQGAASALWGAFLPAVYGTRHLGAVRSLASTLMVVASAIGPGVTGVLIDYGVDLPRQCLAMGLWCLGLSLGMLAVTRRLAREDAATRPEAFATPPP